MFFSISIAFAMVFCRLSYSIQMQILLMILITRHALKIFWFIFLPLVFSYHSRSVLMSVSLSPTMFFPKRTWSCVAARSINGWSIFRFGSNMVIGLVSIRFANRRSSWLSDGFNPHSNSFFTIWIALWNCSCSFSPIIPFSLSFFIELFSNAV